jgi:hypothetical protein
MMAAGMPHYITCNHRFHAADSSASTDVIVKLEHLPTNGAASSSQSSKSCNRAPLSAYGTLRKRVSLSIIVFLIHVVFFQAVSANNPSVSVNPAIGQDFSECNMLRPCRTIEFAIHTRRASFVLLSNGTFDEPSIRVNSSVPFLKISGTRNGTIFDCSRRLSRDGGPAFIVTGASFSVSGVTFQHCVNLNSTSATGGAISAETSILSVTDCVFLHNVAQTGGAIGAISGMLTVTSSSFENNSVTCPNTMSACSAWGGAIAAVETSSVVLNSNVFSDNSVNLDSAEVTGRDSRAAGGGGCVSVLYNSDVSGSRVLIDGNAFRRCSVRMFGSNINNQAAGVQYGNTYGGAVSLYYGLRSVSLLQVQNVTSDFVNNHCYWSTITASVGIGGNSYGGCLSVYAGAWNVITASSSDFASVMVDGMRTKIISNHLMNCSLSTSIDRFSNGMNAYGGGISLVVGTYSYVVTRDFVPGITSVSNSSYVISSNTISSCTSWSVASTSSASSISSFGANAYGGGISSVLGAFMYFRFLNSVPGSHTTVDNSSHTISGNTITYCNSSSSTLSTTSSSSSISHGSNSYGGGISLVVGAYLYFRAGGSLLASTTTFSNSSYNASSNAMVACTASSTSSSATSFASSSGLNAQGGGISLVIGTYSYFRSGDTFSSSTTAVGISSFTFSGNTMVACNAISSTISYFFSTSSGGSNTYGGGISVMIGAYSYMSNRGSVLSSTTVSSNILSVISNTMTFCTASSSASSLSSSLSSSSTSDGINVYGGAISIVIGAYSFGFGATVAVNTSVDTSNYSVTGNTMTSCSALSSTSSLFSSATSNGANSYGGGLSIVFGSYSYFRSGGSFSGSTSFKNSNCTISSNMITYGIALSSTSSSLASASNGANVYGGAILLLVGAYSFGLDGSVSGSTAVSDSSYTLSSNRILSCTASSSTSSPSLTSSSSGSRSYGGGISLVVGAYSYVGFLDSDFILISKVKVEVLNSILENCSSTSVSSGMSNEASSFGGALSAIFEGYVYPPRDVHTNSSFASAQSSSLSISQCNVRSSHASSSGVSCSPGQSNAAGGAVYASLLTANVVVSQSAISHSSVQTLCAAPSLETYSLGGGLAVVRAADVVIDSIDVTNCAARGIAQANNVFVSGGGIFVKDSRSFALKNSVINGSRVEDAFSVFLTCGGGALSTKNISAVEISSSKFYENSDSSTTGVVLLQQLDTGMVVNMTNGTVLSTDPSLSAILPALNITCGINCKIEQQQRLHLKVFNSTLLAHSRSKSEQISPSSIIISLPRRILVSSENSYVNCSFNDNQNIAVIGTHDGERSVLVSCAPCARPFFIARTSRSMNLNLVSSFTEQIGTSDSCRSLDLKLSGSTSDKVQQCPFGVSYCSTIITVTVGFWTNFTADGNVIDAVRCPSNYCGCRNIPNYNASTCQMFPIYAVEFRPEDALCRSNRTGVLCGGCKTNFTQSLNGHSCVHNDICSEALPLVWAVTVIGFFMFSVYVVISSVRKNTGLIMCVLFYGQLSSFSRLPSQTEDASQDSENSAWFSRVTQFDSIVHIYDRSCYGVNMGAYEATAAQLCGPAIVLAASVLLVAASKWLLPRFSDFFQKRGLDVRISFSATMICVILLLFSSVTAVVFELVTCQDVGSERRVFIDGTRKCEGPLHQSLIATAVILSLIPFVFLALLKLNKIPDAARSAVTSAFTDSRYYWGALTLIFRFVATVIFATIRDFPSISALALQVCSLCMLTLLITLRPYVHNRTYYMDIFCNLCLVVQFGLQILVRNSESLGVAVGDANKFRPALRLATTASFVLR